MWEENLGTQAGVHLIEGVRLMWGPLNTGFTVVPTHHAFHGIATVDCHAGFMLGKIIL